MPEIDKLKESKLGHVVMMLYKHPKEIEPVKKVCKGIIDKWARRIHNRNVSYADLTPEQQEELDRAEIATLPARRRSSVDAGPVDGRLTFDWRIESCFRL